MVVFPLKRLMNGWFNSTRLVVCLVTVFSVIISIPLFFKNSVHEIAEGKFEVETRDGYSKFYIFAIRCICGAGLPCVILIFANVFIVYGKRSRENKLQSEANKVSKADRNLYRVVFLVTISTLVLKSIRCTMGCIKFSTIPTKQEKEIYKCVKNYFVVLEYSLCLLMYSLPSQRFRRNLSDSVSCKKRKNRISAESQSVGYSSQN